MAIALLPVGDSDNLEQPIEQVRRACAALAEITDTRLIAVSDLYSNPPMGPQDQPDYVNAVAGVTCFSPDGQERISTCDLFSPVCGFATPGDTACSRLPFDIFPTYSHRCSVYSHRLFCCMQAF